MSHDVILGSTGRTWARDLSDLPDPFDPPAPPNPPKTPASPALPIELTTQEKERIEKLALLEMRSSNGDVAAQKKLVEVSAALNDLVRRSKKGDAKATRILATLKDTGLVQQIAATSKKVGPKLAMAGVDLAMAGVDLAMAGVGFNGHLAFIQGLGEEEMALATESGSAEKAALLRHYGVGATPVMTPIVDGLPHPFPMTAEQKEDIRSYLRHLPALDGSVEADQSRMTTQLRNVFGDVKAKAKAGDPASLKKWGELVEWTNRLQEQALTNDVNSLIQLRTISRTEVFNPRFRVAG